MLFDNKTKSISLECECDIKISHEFSLFGYQHYQLAISRPDL